MLFLVFIKLQLIICFLGPSSLFEKGTEECQTILNKKWFFTQIIYLFNSVVTFHQFFLLYIWIIFFKFYKNIDENESENNQDVELIEVETN